MWIPLLQPPGASEKVAIAYATGFKVRDSNDEWKQADWDIRVVCKMGAGCKKIRNE